MFKWLVEVKARPAGSIGIQHKRIIVQVDADTEAVARVTAIGVAYKVQPTLEHFQSVRAQFCTLDESTELAAMAQLPDSLIAELHSRLGKREATPLNRTLMQACVDVLRGEGSRAQLLQATPVAWLP